MPEQASTQGADHTVIKESGHRPAVCAGNLVVINKSEAL